VQIPRAPHGWRRFAALDVRDAAARIQGLVERTPLAPFDSGDERVELRLKLENRQATGAFKARGASHQIALLDAAQRARGVVACSSGNHAGSLAWAAARAGVPATVLMPEDAYPNKIAACRERGATVILAPTREAAEVRCAELVAQGLTLVHPYAAERTLLGAGTVGLEIAEDWPEVELVVAPVGGGGLLSGCALALRQALGEHVRVAGVEPAGAPSMHRGVEAGRPVTISPITTKVQGLCPLDSGAINIEVVRAAVDALFLLEDEDVFATQAELVRAGETVEPAGAAATALVRRGLLPEEWLAGRGAANPLRVAAIVSGANADPAQLESLRGAR
jgi:threonine dehydratase